MAEDSYQDYQQKLMNMDINQVKDVVSKVEKTVDVIKDEILPPLIESLNEIKYLVSNPILCKFM